MPSDLNLTELRLTFLVTSSTVVSGNQTTVIPITKTETLTKTGTVVVPASTSPAVVPESPAPAPTPAPAPAAPSETPAAPVFTGAASQVNQPIAGLLAAVMGAMALL